MSKKMIEPFPHAEPFPCGCFGYFEQVVPHGGHKNTKRQVILVNPTCKFDADKVGKTLPYVRYIAHGLVRTFPAYGCICGVLYDDWSEIEAHLGREGW